MRLWGCLHCYKWRISIVTKIVLKPTVRSKFDILNNLSMTEKRKKYQLINQEKGQAFLKHISLLQLLRPEFHQLFYMPYFCTKPESLPLSNTIPPFQFSSTSTSLFTPRLSQLHIFQVHFLRYHLSTSGGLSHHGQSHMSWANSWY
jgi:hypothetical protein